jgi:hypothetical protein
MALSEFYEYTSWSPICCRPSPLEQWKIQTVGDLRLAALAVLRRVGHRAKAVALAQQPADATITSRQASEKQLKRLPPRIGLRLHVL